jgi:hypothetical protein
MARGERFFLRLWVVATLFWAALMGTFVPFVFQKAPTPTPKMEGQYLQAERDPKCDQYKKEMKKPHGASLDALWTLGNCEPRQIGDQLTSEPTQSSEPQLVPLILLFAAIPSVIVLLLGVGLAWAIRGLTK